MATVPLGPAAQRAGSALRNIPELLGRLLTKPARLSEQFFGGLVGNQRSLAKGFNPLRQANFGPRSAIGFEKIDPKLLSVRVGKKGSRLMTPDEVKAAFGPDTRWVPKTGGVGGKGGYYEKATKYSRPEYSAGDLTSGGMAAQGAGYALGYGAPAATLGAVMSGGSDEGEEQQMRDPNGVKSRNYNEDVDGARAKFNQSYLGGSRSFTMPKYQAIRQKSKWVDTAIAEMGKENYMKARRSLMDGKMNGQQFHDLLTSAVAGLDDDVTKQAATDPYVLPGIVRGGNNKGRFVVISPVKSKDSKQSSYTAFKYDIDDLDENNPSTPQ
jgi:hypothetical protein